MIGYKFRCLDISDYEIEFLLKAKSILFDKIFLATKKNLIKRGNTKVKDIDTDKITKFEIIPKFYNLLNVAMRSKTRKLKKVVSRDGIYILNHSCKKAWFERDQKGDWDIYIIIGGQYVKKT